MNKDLLKNLPFLLFLMFFIFPIFGKFGIFLLVVAGVIFGINYLISRKKLNNPMSGAIDMDKLKNMDNVKRGVVTGIIAIFGLWLFFASIVVVDAGETGVYSLFGKVRDNELKSGFHLVIPLARVEKMSIRTEEYTMSIVSGEGNKMGDDSITALTKEGLSVGLDLTALYHLDESKASDVYRELGINYNEKIIRPIIRTAIRNIVAGYEAKEMYSSKREEAAQKIKDQVQTELDTRGIVLEDMLLRDVRLPENLAKSIQEKLQAEQSTQKYDFLLQTEKKEKERKIIEAEGQRDAQKIINESLTTNYLYYQYINTLKDRQGTIYVPTSPTTGMPTFKELGK
ncbi:prohibitin family protein [Candidatus Parcubacteria bacterium]|nr:prohibitin family protein [Patescibacteria group bacterium]MBU4309136.1 prohibitin family protein [Patescibacteria group bacterium]MBU4432177.1 prohibitin family protein [Patescibacteria group bacterium]MBU4577497.1 prohibitin family protein [Patescibacteria group bacterium]MCG2697184.1 prohibitin family protein [Candidatus Parcubacteria bacterium]